MSENNDNQSTGTPPETFSREYVEGLRAEAAKYRTEKNDAVEAAKAEVTTEYTSKIEALEAQIAEAQIGESTARTEVDRLKVTIESGIDHDKAFSFAELLKGDNEDELKSHAEQLKALFTTDEAPKTKAKATDPSQGNAGNPLPLNGDPLLEAVLSKINRR